MKCQCSTKPRTMCRICGVWRFGLRWRQLMGLLPLLLGSATLEGCPSSSETTSWDVLEARGQGDQWDVGLDGTLRESTRESTVADTLEMLSELDSPPDLLPDHLDDVPVPDVQPPVGECCMSDGDCGAKGRCVGPYPGGAAAHGVCAEVPGSPRCYADSDCPTGAACEGANWCQCGQHCDPPALPGWCVSPDAGCCGSDDDCIGTGDCILGHCLGVSFVGGGFCWHDANCESNEECVGEFVCPCGYSCPVDSALGTCHALGPDCCETDEDCDGQICLRKTPASPGVCGPELAPGSCYSSHDCAPGNVCNGAMICQCSDNCAPAMGSCGACCTDNSSCEEGYVCVLGSCRLASQVPRCWQVSDCTHDPSCSGDGCATQFDCQGEVICQCGTTCAHQEVMGWCLPLDVQGPNCCVADSDCWEGTVCVQGKCLISPAGGACWESSGCTAGEECIGAEVEPCGQHLWPDFLPKIGWCGGAAKCCGTDAECPAPLVCAGLDSGAGLLGQCRAPTEATNDCWTDSECAQGFECVGVLACGCDPLCDKEQVGFCEKTTFVPCCGSDAGCQDEERCVGNLPNKQNGRCVPTQVAGQCYEDSDCGSGQCVGETTCSCELECSPVAGTCTAQPQCCETDEECEDAGDVCAAGRCKAVPPYGACWSDQDCPAPGILECLGAFVCPCNESCNQNDHAGVCMSSTETCCGTAAQCGEGDLCLHTGAPNLQGRCYRPAEYPECWSSSDCEEGATCWDANVCACEEVGCVPNMGMCLTFEACCEGDQDCLNTEVCVHPEGQPTADGTCKSLVQPGSCWNSQSCPAGQTCQGAKVCPCGALCLVADQLGTCQ